MDNQLVWQWNKAVESQMHFAELSLKMRTSGLTLAGAVLALGIVLNQTLDDPNIQIACLSLPLTAFIFYAAGLILSAICIIDVFVYHKMLRGATKCAEQIEKELFKEVTSYAGLVETVSAYSRCKDDPTFLNQRDEAGRIWLKTSRTAGNRILTFYIILIISLILTGTMLLVAGAKVITN